MDVGIVGAIVGTVLGFVGSVIGTTVSLRNAKSNEERRYLIKWAIAFSVLIGGFLAGLSLAPAAYRTWIWLLYVLLLPWAIFLSNRGHARFHADHRGSSV
jgi:hypothetical protein